MTRYLAGLSLLFVVGVLAPGCDDDPAKPPVTPPPVDTNWNQGMELDQLKTIAEALGIELVEEGSSSKITKEDVVSALEETTGCGCYGAVCGTGDCDHDCGSCAGTGEACFAGTCETATSCPLATPTAADQSAKLRNDTESLKFRYDAELPAGSAFDRIRIFYNAAVDAPLGPGTYNLRHRSMADCKPCVVAYTGCGPDGACSQPFIAQAGMVSIEDITPDGRFKGNLDEVKFEAAYEDPKTGFFYTLPALGQDCVTTFDFDTELVSEVIEPEECDPEGNGTGIGNKLANFALQNCLGEDVELHSGCGKKALWLIAAAGW